MSITETIKSLQSTVGASYKRPNPERMAHYQTALMGNDTALDYLRITRNLTDETIKNFGLGYDSDKHAIAIPVYKRGELINIRYRFLDTDETGKKYIQEKDAELWLYNEDGIQMGIEKGGVLIVEGEFDLMSAWQAGFKNVVSPSSGKDSYGVWLELIDNIPKVYIAYDNDVPGKEAAKKMADRMGVEKCKEIIYPAGIKDANDYFKKFSRDDFRVLIKNSRPFYNHDFKGVMDIIDMMRNGKRDTIQLKHLPFVEIEDGCLMIVSGVSNVGKTAYVLNLVAELSDRNIPSLVLPFERGIQSVGSRYLQVKYGLRNDEFSALDPASWDKITKESLNAPVYFSLPKKADLYELIKKSKRIFDTKFVIVDHLDYIIRNTQNKESEIGTTLQELKRIAEENKMVMVVVTHLRKIQAPGMNSNRKPHMEDLKGSSSLYQDPEVVVILDSPRDDRLLVDIPKNKGMMGSKEFDFNRSTGKIGVEVVKSPTSDGDDW